MGIHWTDKSTACRVLAEGLAAKGWNLYGYTEDRSDIMTDYYAPAHWNGAATHPAHPGAVVVCDYGLADSGKIPTRTEYDRGETCRHCIGTGTLKRASTGKPWTLQEARAEPAAYHAARLAAEYGTDHSVRVLCHDVVSPLQFGDDGNAHCPRCSGRGHKLVARVVNEPAWPVWKCATPKGAFAHVERGGKILLAIRGAQKLAWSSTSEAELAKILASIDSALQGPAPSTLWRRARREHCAELATTGPTPIDSAAPPCILRPGRRPGIVELQFDAKPDAETRTALKGAGFRWAPSSGCWYGPEAALPPAIRKVFILDATAAPAPVARPSAAQEAKLARGLGEFMVDMAAELYPEVKP